MAKGDRLAKKAKRRKWKQFREIGFFNMFKVWRRKNNKHVEIDAALANYVENFSLGRLPESLHSLYKETQAQEQSAMQIDPTEAQFLKLLVYLTKAKKVLEIGTFRGWSGAVLAEALVQNDGTLVTIESRLEQANFSKSMWEKYLDPATRARIHLINKPALEVLGILDSGGELMEKETTGQNSGTSARSQSQSNFDLIFIDADKANYGEYLKYAKKFLSSGGIIVLDNMLNAGLVSTSASDRTTNAIRDLNAQIFSDQDPMFEPFMIPAWDGVVVLRKVM